MAVLLAPIVLLDQLPQLQQHVQEAFIVLQELKLNCCVHWDNINLFLVKHLVNYVMQDLIVMVLIQLHIKYVQGDIIVQLVYHNQSPAHQVLMEGQHLCVT